MEVAIGSNNSNTPFQREVREWQRVDPNTGALLSGRLEADRWINGPLNAYGKVVNSQNISQPNGIQQSQRKQLEVLQTRTSSGGSLQVVRAQTVQMMTSTSSSSSLPSSYSSHFWPPSSSQSLSSSSTAAATSASSGTATTLYQHQSNHYNHHIKKNQSFNSQHFNDEYHHHHHNKHKQLTNNHMPVNSHDDHLTTPLGNSINSNSTIASNNHNSNRLLLTTAPSVKLSSLMKSTSNTTSSVNAGSAGSVITNNVEGRNSPHFLTTSNSMSLLQQRQQQNQHESETQSSSFTTDRRYHQPTTTVGEVRVGVGDINTNQMEPLRNERETTTTDHKHNNYNNSKEELLSQYHRGRSISTDDLTTEWDHSNDDGIDESSEWRRVSKIRRSFQFPKSISPKTNMSRPNDLPDNSGSVLRIRNELENGRRLNTAMKGNNVDLAALNNILNGARESDVTINKTTKKTTFLTAESLKEIRGKLKKLSDESLYKDDFITQQNNTEGIITDKEELVNHDSNGFSIQQPIVLQDAHTVQQQTSSFQYHPKLEGNYTTNSLENRTRYRDTNSAEWHIRRKSYGFEKMTSSDNPVFQRMETSTDSGIGRSGDLTNWSPTENTSPSSVTISEDKLNNSQKTTVTLTNGIAVKPFDRSTVVQRRIYNNNYTTIKSSLLSSPAEVKRHSIAVDETKYVVGGENMRKAFEAKSSSVHLNGYGKDTVNVSSSTTDENGRRQKRVEFCKTEVHFAAESGRVNIVETDGKPPPTNNFRRRRRSSLSLPSSSSSSPLSPGNNVSNSYLEAINSGMQIIHFGDNQHQNESEFEESINYKNISGNSNVTISIPIKSNGDNNKNSTIERNNMMMMPKTVVEIQEDENTNNSSDEVSLRSILKNKLIKPKPYHLGENIENNESLWGVRLRPVTASTASSTIDDNNDRNYITDKNSPELNQNHKEISDSNKSVAERIKIVEERKDGSGYSTKINLNLSSSPYSWDAPESETYIEEKPTTILRLEDSSSSSLSSNNTSPSSTSSTASTSATPSQRTIISNHNTININNNNNKTQLTIFHDNLKSTSLIMKTMRFNNNCNNNNNPHKSSSDEDKIEKSNYIYNNKSINTEIKSSKIKVISNNDNILIKTSNEHHNAYKDRDYNDKKSHQKYTSSLNCDYNIMQNDSKYNNSDAMSTKPITVMSPEKSLSPNSGNNFSKISLSSTGSSLHQNELAQITNSNRTVHLNYHQYTQNIDALCKEIDNLPSIVSSRLGNYSHENKEPITTSIPRIQVVGASNAISHQLSQLRQIYDSSGHESDDSAKADEEVKHIFNGGCNGRRNSNSINNNNYSTDEDTSINSFYNESKQISSSWSRVKAQRTIIKKQEEVIKDDIKEYPNTNIMSIELRAAPSSSITNIKPSEVISQKFEVPIPKPRTVSPVKILRNTFENDQLKNSTKLSQQQPQKQEQQKQLQNDVIERKPIKKVETVIKDKEPLKVVNGGARKLRDHELSYFGINANRQETTTRTKTSQQRSNNIVNSIINNPNSNQKVLNNNNNNIDNENTINNQKWKPELLSSDKPDLLRHSPVVQKRNNLQNPQPTQRKLNNNNNNNDENDGPIYENLKKPSTYIRKKDLERDEKILSEMAKTADQTLKTVSNFSSQSRDQDHYQSQRSSKPLDTIDEKSVTHKNSSKLNEKNVKNKPTSRNNQHNFPIDNFQRPCCSNRSSSISSIESLSRYPSSSSLKATTSTSRSHQSAKESSLSKSGRIEYANIRSTKKLSSSSSNSVAAAKPSLPATRDSSSSSNKIRHRSQSREKQYNRHQLIQQQARSHHHLHHHSHESHSSSEDLANNPKIELIPRIKKTIKTRDKEISSRRGEKDNNRNKSSSFSSSSLIKTKTENKNDHHLQHHSLRSTLSSATSNDDHHINKSKKSNHISSSADKSIEKISSSKTKRSSISPSISTSDHPSYHLSNSSRHNPKIRTKSSSTSGIISSTSSSSKHRTSKEHTRK